MDNVLMWIASSITYGTIILFGALGEILTEKSGHLNLGVPGMMFFGGFAGFAAVFKYEQSHVGNTSEFALVIIPLLVGFLAAAGLGLLYSFFTVTLKANQNVTGLAITFLGVGLGSFYGQKILQAAKMGYGRTAATAIFTKSLFDGFDIGFMVIVGIVVAVILQLFLSKTRKGLNLRAVGENPATADAAGINVNLYKYLATIIGAGICGLGGAMYIGIKGWTTNNNIEALGWLAVALVIFATWKPANAIWGSYVFALFCKLETYFSDIFKITWANAAIRTIVGDILQMIPYVITILILIIIAFRKKKENQPPASLGLSYFREER